MISSAAAPPTTRRVTPAVLARQVLGPLGDPLAEASRTLFIDLNELGRTLRSVAPEVSRILDLGCGHGQFTTRLATVFPDAEVVGIDTRPDVGTMFTGDLSRVRFFSTSVAAFAATSPSSFDLVTIVDVLHHVPKGERTDLVRIASSLARAGGLVAVKDWERRLSFGHALAWFSDRVITGDRVSFPSRAELLSLVASCGEPVLEARVPPRRHNLLLVARKRSGTAPGRSGSWRSPHRSGDLS